MKKIFLLIFCLLPVILLAQSASDYFHKAANFYVNADKKNARATIKEGIQNFPDDSTLKGLASKIEELPDPEENQEQQKQQNQDNQDDNNKEQDKQQQRQQQQQDKRQLDALQQNERQTQKKVAEEEMKKGGKSKQEKDW